MDGKKDLKSLYNPGLINEKFIESHAKKAYHPKTTQSYLMSLRHFYAFFLTEEMGKFIPVPKESVLSLKEKISRWSSSFRQTCAKRHWEKMEEDIHQLITPTQVKELEQSKAARDAICLLGQLSVEPNMDISQSQFTLIRDFLIVQISIDNANRAGAIANMKMTELKKKFKQDGEYVILVKAHKTLSTHGPARVIMSEKLFRWVDIYAKEVRSKVSGDERHLVFLSWNGEQLCSSQINKAIKSIRKKAEVSGNPSSTLFRKSAVSGFHKAAESSEMRDSLADLMAHM